MNGQGIVWEQDRIFQVWTICGNFEGGEGEKVEDAWVWTNLI